jgi:hypothetical protein
MKFPAPLAVFTASAVATLACGSNPTAPSDTARGAQSAATFAMTVLSFTSDPRDFVGQGESRAYTLENAVFQPGVGRAGRQVSLGVRPNGGAPSRQGRCSSLLRLVSKLRPAPTTRRILDHVIASGVATTDENGRAEFC